MSRFRSILLLMAIAAVLPACGGDDSPTAPSITFPTLPAALLANFCVRGDRAPNQGISGAVETTDCPLGDGSYYEAWRVRVATNGAYRFAASSTFDNVLALLRLDSYTDQSATLTVIASDDDSGTGSNALIASVTLTAGQDYFLLVNGYDGSDTGPYTVTFAAQ